MGSPIDDVIAWLRQQADVYAEAGAMLDGAKFCRAVANRLERAWLEYQAEALTIREAAELRGEHYTTTYRKLKAGKLPNVGTEDHPRIRRCDLFSAHRDGPDLAGKILGG